MPQATSGAPEASLAVTAATPGRAAGHALEAVAEQAPDASLLEGSSHLHHYIATGIRVPRQPDRTGA